MVSLTQFKTADGKTDWGAYRAAQVAAGDICQRCGAYVGFFGLDRSGPCSCSSCRELDTEAGDVSHRSFIRCPKCGGTWDPCHSDDYDIFADGDHDVTCPDCEHEFEMVTHVSYTFQSPPRVDGER